MSPDKGWRCGVHWTSQPRVAGSNLASSIRVYRTASPYPGHDDNNRPGLNYKQLFIPHPHWARDIRERLLC